MNKNGSKKCKMCGATLVGKKNNKLGLCSNCLRKTGHTVGAVTGGLAFLGTLSLAIKNIVKSIKA